MSTTTTGATRQPHFSGGGQVGARASRRSVGGLSLSPMSMSMVGTGNSGGNKYTNFFSSWRRSYRLRSKSSSSSAHKNNSTRKKDTKSLENLLDDERPIPRYSLDYEDEQDFMTNNKYILPA